jgi:multicomponent Na+:H+ antiporter subunit G
MTLAYDIVMWACLGAGGFFVFVGGIGALRMPDLYTRLHAVSVTETLGTLLIVVGLMLHSGGQLATFKLFAILVFLFFTSPISSYALANTAQASGLKPILDEDRRKSRES